MRLPVTDTNAMVLQGGVGWRRRRITVALFSPQSDAPTPIGGPGRRPKAHGDRAALPWPSSVTMAALAPTLLRPALHLGLVSPTGLLPP
jgi:hypothetical protein